MKSQVTRCRVHAAILAIAATALALSGFGCGNGSLRTARGSGAYKASSLDGIAGELLVMSALPALIPPGGATQLEADGGVPPYSFTVLGDGSVNSTLRRFTAGLSEGFTTVQVRDSAGGVASVNITVQDTIAISPSTQSIGTGTTVTFTATGGVPPYSFSKVSGVGTLSGQAFMAGMAAGFAQIQVTDSANRIALANVAVTSATGALTISPATATVTTGGTITFNATGGATPYAFALISGLSTGTLSGRVFTAGSVPTTAQVEVYDANGDFSISTVTVQAGSANTPINASATAATDYYFGISFDNNNGTGPQLVLWGVGPEADALAIGKNVTGCANYGTSYNDLGSPCAVSIPLTNLAAIRYPTTTYNGAVTMTGRTGSTQVEFCVPPMEPSKAYLRVTSSDHSTALGDEEFFQNIRYSFFGLRLVGGRGVRAHFSKLDNEKGAGSVSVQLQNAGFSTDTSCTGYSSDSHVSVDGS